MVFDQVRKNEYYVYILRCVDGSYYVGSSSDLSGRLRDHLRGHGAEWTKAREPVELVYQECYSDLISARRREKQLKGWSRIKKEKLIRGEWKKIK